MTLLRDISTLLTSLFSFVLFMILFQSRLPQRRTMVLTLCTMLPLLLVNFILFFLVGAEKMTTLMLLTCSLPSLIFFWTIAKYRDGRFFFTFCMVDTLILEILFLSSIIDFFLGDTYIFTIVSRTLLCPLLAFIVYRWVKPVYLRIQEHITIGWYTFTAIALIFYMVLSLSMSVPTMITQRQEQLPAFILLLILMPAIYIHIFTTLLNQQRTHKASHDQAIMDLKVEKLTARIEELNAAEEKFRMERHNFRHKLNTIAGLLEQGNTEELKTLLARYYEDIQDTHMVRYSHHAILDAVLAHYLTQAKRKDIPVSVHVHFPDTLSVDEAELATVFANALDNAINACCQMPQEQRLIEIQVLTVPRFMIQFSNSCQGEILFNESGLPLATEEDHGYGTRYIAAFCEKSQSFCEFKAENGRFTLRILLP